MKIKTTRIIGAALTLITILICGSAKVVRACDCIRPGAPCQEFWQADAVFVGQPVDSSRLKVKSGNFEYEQRAVRFIVAQSLRGVEGTETEVVTGLGGGDCGYPFERGVSYLVYAYRGKEDKRLYTGICTRTRPVTEADEDMAYIRGLSKAKPEAMIIGEVVKNRRTENGVLDEQPMANMMLTIEGEGKRLQARTKEDGKFIITGLPAGTYKIKLPLPDGVMTPEPERTLKIVERGCGQVYFGVEADGRLSGRVLSSVDNAPIANAQISLSAAGVEQYRGHWDIVYTDKQGRYEFKRIPPGNYILGIRFDGKTSQESPFPEIYYPNVKDRAAATIVTIGEGERIKNYDLIMPPLPIEREIKGSVVWDDGQPAPNAHLEYEAGAVLYGVKLDEQGHFSFKVYEGVSVALRAGYEVSKGKYAYSEWVKTPASGEAPPLKIIVPRQANWPPH